MADPQKAIHDDGNTVTAVVVDQKGNAQKPTYIQLLSLRRIEDSPAQYSPGKPLSSINLPAGYLTADVTHVVLWADGFVAQDWHSNAPRLGRLSQYLRQSRAHFVHFDSLYDQSLQEKLADVRGQLRSAEIAFTTPGRYSGNEGGTFTNLIPARIGTRAPSVGVKFGMGRFGPRDSYLNGDVQEEILAVAERAAELVDRMIVTGRSRSTGRTITINLLTERLGSDTEIVSDPAHPSLPAATSAFAALTQLRADLEASGALTAAVHGQPMKGK